MGRTARKICATILTAVLSSALVAATAQTAFAACRPGDLAGKWSMYGTGASSLSSVALRCNVTLTKASAAPFHYSISGNCRFESSAGTLDGPSPISGTRTLAESATCKFTGTFDITDTGTDKIERVTIVDGRVDSSGLPAAKSHIEALGGSNFSGLRRIYNLSFVR